MVAGEVVKQTKSRWSVQHVVEWDTHLGGFEVGTKSWCRGMASGVMIQKGSKENMDGGQGLNPTDQPTIHARPPLLPPPLPLPPPPEICQPRIISRNPQDLHNIQDEYGDAADQLVSPPGSYSRTAQDLHNSSSLVPLWPGFQVPRFQVPGSKIAYCLTYIRSRQ